jgi:prepilin-type N-terminal cleavage/methylation domain-containing protein
MARVKNNLGFTLLEIMVSITILTLIVLMISRIFSSSTQAVERGKNQTLLDETARMLLDVIEQDISQALIRTNVAFRVQSINDNDALYFISTGVRRQSPTLQRDTAPMRLQAEHGTRVDAPNWNWSVMMRSPDNSAGNTSRGIRNLIQQSDYYYSIDMQSAPDFIPIHTPAAEMPTAERKYTHPIETGMNTHAVLTFMELTVNADPDWNGNAPDGSPDLANMPRFIDVTIGLIASKDMQLAILRDSPAQVENNERIYARRIFMRNTGIDQLGL